MFSRISNNGGGNRKGNTTNTAIDSSPTNKWLFVQTRNQPAQQNSPQNINHHLHSPPPTHPQQHRELSNSPIVGMSISSSFDVISGGGSILSDNTIITNSPPLPPSQTPPNPFIAHFEELNRLPIGHWLKKGGGGVGTNQQQNGTPKNIVQATIIPDLATMLREIQLREDEEQRSSSPQQHHQQRKRVANGEEQKMASPVDLDGKGWLKSDAATAMWSSPSCAAVITGILASSLEDWLAQPPAAKIARRQHNQQQKQSPTTTTMMGMGHEQQQEEKFWAPTWATTAMLPAGNCNEEDEENGFTATVHHQNGVGHRRRTETANSSISSSLYSSLYYNYRFGNEKEAQVDEEPRNHGHGHHHNIADELLPMLSQVKSLRTGLEELEEKLKGMLLMEGGENNPADGTETIVANEEEEYVEEQMVDKIEEETTKTANDGQEHNYFLEPPVFSSPNLLDGPSPPLLKLPSDQAHWLKKYPPPKPKRPMNEMAEDLSCWESVLGWKGILEKIHASGEHVWLAPSSRALKG